MKFQHIYKTNTDYEATLDFFCSTKIPHVIEPKGALHFWAGQNKISVMLFPSGNLQIGFSDSEEKKKTMPYIERLLVPRKGEERIFMTPISGKTNVYNIPFPPPQKLEIPYCKRVFSFIRKLGLFGYLDRRPEHKLREKQYEDEKIDRNIRELDCRIAIRQEVAHLDRKDPEYHKKRSETVFRLRKQHDLV